VPARVPDGGGGGPARPGTPPRRAAWRADLRRHHAGPLRGPLGAPRPPPRAALAEGGRLRPPREAGDPEPPARGARPPRRSGPERSAARAGVDPPLAGPGAAGRGRGGPRGGRPLRPRSLSAARVRLGGPHPRARAARDPRRLP